MKAAGMERRARQSHRCRTDYLAVVLSTFQVTRVLALGAGAALSQIAYPIRARHNVSCSTFSAMPARVPDEAFRRFPVASAT
jgi:hypothetical protein